MEYTGQSPIKTGQILVAALVFGMVSFAAVAAVMGKATSPDLATPLFIVIAALGVTEGLAYHLLVKPMMVNQFRREALALDASTRPAFLEQRYLTLIIVAAALAEGWGLLGAVTTLVTGRFESLGATAVAVMGLLVIMPGQYRFEKFVRLVEGNEPFPRA